MPKYEVVIRDKKTNDRRTLIMDCEDYCDAYRWGHLHLTSSRYEEIIAIKLEEFTEYGETH